VTIEITDGTFPWKKADNVYSDDGPKQIVTFIAAGAQMRVEPTSRYGRDTGRTRFKVECMTCAKVLHPGTTSASSMVAGHLERQHGWDGSPAQLVIEPLALEDAVVDHVQAERSPTPRTILITEPTIARASAPVALYAPASIWVKTQTRPSWGEQFIMQAYITALRGSCQRKRVGAIIIDQNNRHVAGGFNGAPRGQPDCLSVGCDVRVVDGRGSCVRTLHAESNALDYAGRDARGCALFTTVIPCRPCALRIIQAGIDSVFYSEFYESQGTKETKELLTGAGVKLMQLTLPENELTVALRRAVGEIS
jgi:dCMP deaminase